MRASLYRDIALHRLRSSNIRDAAVLCARSALNPRDAEPRAGAGKAGISRLNAIITRTYYL